MNDTEYLDRAEALLQKVEIACDQINDSTDADIDNQRVGGMVTMTFSNGSQIIVNLQKPLQEIWLAARAGGFHYKFDGSQWMDTKGQGEFFAQLNACASEELPELVVVSVLMARVTSALLSLKVLKAGAYGIPDPCTMRNHE